MTQNFQVLIRRYVVFLVLALVSTTVITVPIEASELEGGPGLLDDSTPHDIVTEEEKGTGTEEDEPNDDTLLTLLEELIKPAPIGPVGFVDSPTYEVVRVPGGIVPSHLTVMADNDNIDLVTFANADELWFLALMVIQNADAPTEYRFEKAVPAEHSAVLQRDGSVIFYDTDGKESGGILAPWAIDATGAAVPTNYSLDGDTLVQRVDHHGAVYPVVADPNWWDVASTALLIVGAATCAATGCALPAAAVVAVSTVVQANSLSSSSTPPTGSGRPSNTCNARNRAGC